MNDLSELSDKARLECGWMTTFNWDQLKAIPAVTDVLNSWTHNLIKYEFNVHIACPHATDHKYTFGELSSGGREDWMKYAEVLKTIYKREN